MSVLPHCPNVFKPRKKPNSETAYKLIKFTFSEEAPYFFVTQSASVFALKSELGPKNWTTS